MAKWAGYLPHYDDKDWCVTGWYFESVWTKATMLILKYITIEPVPVQYQRTMKRHRPKASYTHSHKMNTQ